MLRYGAALTENIEPGRHTLQVDNTLFKKTMEFVAGVNDHVVFKTANLAGWGTYSAWALLIGFLGAGPFYLMLERDGSGRAERRRRVIDRELATLRRGPGGEGGPAAARPAASPGPREIRGPGRRASSRRCRRWPSALSADDPELAKALRTAWQLPARSLAFRNAAHQEEHRVVVVGAGLQTCPR